MKQDIGTAAGAVQGSRLAERLLEREEKRRRREEEERRAEQEKERPFQELREAACRLGHWRSQLSQALGRQPTDEEAAERLASASSELRSVLQTHRFEDFLEFLRERRWSGPFAEDNHEACEFLHELISEPTDDSQAEWLTLLQANTSVSNFVFNVLASDLPDWAFEYRRIAQLEATLTLDDLIGLLHMSSAGIGFLVRKLSDVREIRELFLQVYSPELTFCKDDLRRFAIAFDQQRRPDTVPAKDITLNRLKGYFEGWLADCESRGAAVADAALAPILDPFSVHPTIDAFATRCREVADNAMIREVHDRLALSNELAALREGMILAFDAEDREVLREFRSIADEVYSRTVRCFAPNLRPRLGMTDAEAYDEFAKYYQELRRFDFSKLKGKSVDAASAPPSVAPAPDSPDAQVKELKLSERQEGLLAEMLAMGAERRSKRVKQLEVVARLNPADSVDNYKRDFAQLKKLKLTDGEAGRDGGVWLTSLGQKTAQQLSV